MALPAAFLLASCDGHRQSVPPPPPLLKEKIPAKPSRPALPAHTTDVSVTKQPGDPTFNLRERLALALAETNPGRRTSAIEAVAWHAVQTDPELFREAFSALASGTPEAGRLLAHRAVRLAEGDPEAAMALADSVAADASFAEVAGAIAVALAEKDPRGSAALVARLADETVQARCAVQVLQRWSATEPAAAAAWVAAFPEGPTRSDGLSVVLQSWLRQDPAGLASWVQTPAADDLRTEAITTLALLINQQPETARPASLLLFPQVRLSPGP